MNNLKKQPSFLHSPIHKHIGLSLFPHKDNNYHPHILKPKPLSGLVIFFTFLKVSTTLFFFFIYPNLAYLSSEIQDQIISFANYSRKDNALVELSKSEPLVNAASLKARDMINNQYFNHNTPNGKKPWEWIDKNIYNYTNAGENLAMDFSSAESVHYALMQSPTHKKNILNPKFEDIGVSVQIGELQGKKTMLMVQMFGKQSQDQTSPIKQEIKNIETKEYVVPKKIIEPSSSNNSNIKNYQTISLLSPDEPVIRKSEGELVAILDDKKTDVYTVGSINPNDSVFSSVNKKLSTINSVQNVTNNILYSALYFLLTVFAFNIFIKIKVQHPVVIVQSFLAIVFIFALISTKLHFIQQIKDVIIVG
jgi:uncharacterized protein YkwD